jgi:acyl-CoA thioester hydrolase
MDPTTEFRVSIPVAVRFKDVDVGGHVHHSHALVYFEEARAAYWSRVTGRSGLEAVDYILAEARVRYHQRILWPQTVDVGVATSRLGKRHFELSYAATAEGGTLLLTGTTVQVMYDYEAGTTKAMPTSVRDAMAALDGPFGPGGRRQERSA